MSTYYDTHYRYTAGARATTAGLNSRWSHLDGRLNSLERRTTFGTTSFETVVGYVIPGDPDPGTHVHFQLQISSAPDFSDVLVERESADAQTNWLYFKYDEGEFTQVPAGGVLADSTADGEPANYSGCQLLYVVADAETYLTAGNVYYWRIRQVDVEGEENGDWQGGAFRA